MKRLGIIVLALTIAVMSKNTVEAKQPTAVSGNFKYTYSINKDGAYITKITPLSSKGIKTLAIPQKLGGKPVVKLIGDGYTSNCTDIFGIVKCADEDDSEIEPKNIYKRVNKIKKIKIPDTVKEVTDGCFVYFSSGKSVNIPQNADLLSSLRICDVALGTEKVTISPKNKYCKIKDGCLLTKDGKELLDIVDNRKKVVVPSCVKKITASMRKCVKTIVIPKSVNSIKYFGARLSNDVKIKISKENKKYAATNGIIYLKKSKKMVTGKTVNGVLQIPKQIREIGQLDYYGNNYPKKVVIPENIKRISSLAFDSEKNSIIVECKGKIPPQIESGFNYEVSHITVYVPKGCVETYKNACKFPIEEHEILDFIEK